MLAILNTLHIFLFQYFLVCRYRLQRKNDTSGQQPGGTTDVGHSGTGKVRRRKSLSLNLMFLTFTFCLIFVKSHCISDESLYF